jgi:hypothetical protein
MGKTLGMYLTELQVEDPACVFIARRISRMGFRSREALLRHYSKYGKVKRVLVAHSRVKSYQEFRIRPGSLGFIVMTTASSVQKIFAAGKDQTICGCTITLEPFSSAANRQDAVRRALVEEHDSLGSSISTGSGKSSGSHNSRSPAGYTSSESLSDQGTREKTEGACWESQHESSDAGSADGTQPATPGNDKVSASA